MKHRRMRAATTSRVTQLLCLGATVFLVGISTNACFSSSSGGGGSSGSGATSGTGGEATCSDVLDCSPVLGALTQLPGCKDCLTTSCSSEIAGCGTNNANCSASVACFDGPMIADLEVNGGACKDAPLGETWPTWCYMTRQACLDTYSTEPSGKALVFCLIDNCDACLNGKNLDCAAPPTCSTLSK